MSIYDFPEVLLELLELLELLATSHAVSEDSEQGVS